MTISSSRMLVVGAAALLAFGVAQAQADKTTLPLYVPSDIKPLTSHTGDPSAWRLTSSMTFNGASMDGVARLLFTPAAGGTYVCSGALLAGGAHVLTAGHCADDFTSMTIDFGVYNNIATATRGAGTVYLHSGWTGSNLGTGSDLAIIKLDAPVAGIQGFNIATTSQVGQSMLVMGYGTTGWGDGAHGNPNWNEWGWAHWGYNQADVGVQDFDAAWYGPQPPGTYFGDEYIFDFDNGTSLNNTLQAVADVAGGGWTSSTGVGANEVLIAGGDSGGPDLVWSGTEWLVAGIHSWGWQFCGGRISPSCDINSSVSSSYGDLSGSSAVDTHAAWIMSVTAVPEPGTYAMMLIGLVGVAGVARRRKA